MCSEKIKVKATIISTLVEILCQVFPKELCDIIFEFLLIEYDILIRSAGDLPQHKKSFRGALLITEKNKKKLCGLKEPRQDKTQDLFSLRSEWDWFDTWCYHKVKHVDLKAAKQLAKREHKKNHGIQKIYYIDEEYEQQLFLTLCKPCNKYNIQSHKLFDTIVNKHPRKTHYCDNPSSLGKYKPQFLDSHLNVLVQQLSLKMV